MSLTAWRLRELLHYDPLTGVFTWVKDAGRWGRIKAGSVAGHQNSRGYMQIRVDERMYKAHRLAWLYMTGKWPEHQIDHISGVRHENAWCNLREATNSQNQQNVRKARSDNKCGLLGVSRDRDRWKAQIKIDGSNKSLGTFDTPEQAHAAYLEAKARMHPFQMIVQHQESLT